MTIDELKKRLKGKMMYRARLMTQALKRKLVTRDHIVTGKLHDSIRTRTKVTSDGKLRLQVSMLRYGDYINARNDLRPNWHPPRQAIREWARAKGLKPNKTHYKSGKKLKNPFESMISAIVRNMKTEGFMFKDRQKRKVGWLNETLQVENKKFLQEFAIDFTSQIETFAEKKFRAFDKFK
tara:strand:+ start:3475 stop:4014 length:540 start_codon:yes stop_codon:yes gene_type:complete